ncbi:MAG: hypothetical protein IJY50_08440 [Clostridia bacterium]|nr:hypothetical protein [Clostridia bacterium]
MKKTLITILATVLVCCCIVGGTLAWLTDKTETVTNTFTVGDVNIKLTETINETETDVSDAAATANFKMIPGNEIPKDPKVTVLKGSEACWVFVKIVETDTKNLIDWEIAEGWTLVESSNGTSVYYRAENDLSDSANDGTSYSVLKGDKVTVSSTNLVKGETEKPTLVITAYAVQQANLTFNQAWEQAKTLG